jgi:hypothetical protein
MIGQSKAPLPYAPYINYALSFIHVRELGVIVVVQVPKACKENRYDVK